MQPSYDRWYIVAISLMAFSCMLIAGSARAKDHEFHLAYTDDDRTISRSFDVLDVVPGESIGIKIHFLNASSETLQFTRVGVGCACQKALLSNSPLPPGETHIGDFSVESDGNPHALTQTIQSVVDLSDDSQIVLQFRLHFIKLLAFPSENTICQVLESSLQDANSKQSFDIPLISTKDLQLEGIKAEGDALFAKIDFQLLKEKNQVILRGSYLAKEALTDDGFGELRLVEKQAEGVSVRASTNLTIDYVPIAEFKPSVLLFKRVEGGVTASAMLRINDEKAIKLYGLSCQVGEDSPLEFTFKALADKLYRLNIKASDEQLKHFLYDDSLQIEVDLGFKQLKVPMRFQEL